MSCSTVRLGSAMEIHACFCSLHYTTCIQ
jgi:hypothetical protein